MKTYVYSINGFVNDEPPIRIEDSLKTFKRDAFFVTFSLSMWAFPHVAMASTSVHATATAVSSVFDAKIWPLFIDIGKPLTKTMMALGVYKVIRGEDRGWHMVRRAGLGLVCLYLIDGGIHILQGVGENLQQA